MQCFRSGAHVDHPTHNFIRNIYVTRSTSALNKEAIQKKIKSKNKNLLEKFMKDKRKKDEIPVHEIWPNITVNELARKYFRN